MSVSLTNNFLRNARGITFKDGGGITWSINSSTNEISANGSGAGSSGANPTAKVGLAAVNGSAMTFMRSDGAPPIDQAVAPTWTGQHTFTPGTAAPGVVVNANGSTDAARFLAATGQNASVQIAGNGNTVGSTSLLLRQDNSSNGYLWNYANASLFLGTNNTTRLTIAANGAITASGAFAWNGATPPAQVTGFGTPTGAAVVANFSGTAATTAQIQATIAQILAIMKAHGMIGA